MNPGEIAPDFTLPDVHEEPFRLADLYAEKPVLLVLSRGFLCPFSRRHMLRLRRDYPEFVRRGAEVVVVGPENPEPFRQRWVHWKLPFIGVPDPGRIALDRYGQRSALLSLGRLPAQFLIARGGELLLVRHGRNMADIAANGEMLALLDETTGG